jgi:uncharacterized protein (TIGR02996 family)
LPTEKDNMSREHELLRTIAREPDEDAIRLIYSDWLEDHGRADRAAFIRGQVRLDSIRRAVPPPDTETLEWSFGGGPTTVWSCPADSAERRDLAFACRRLLDVHEEEWLAPLRGVLRHDWGWSRGFVETLAADPGSLESHSAALFDRNPIRRLILTGLHGKVDVLASVPADNHLTALDLILDDIDSDALTALAKFSQLGGLTQLNLAFNRLGDSVVGFLCNEPFFQQFTILGLACNPFTDDGRQRLREHFRDRLSYRRERHADRLFTFQGGGDLPLHSPGAYGPGNLRAGWASDRTQWLLLQACQHNTLAVFDHAGNLLRAETRWDEERNAWLRSLECEPAPIKVKRIPGVYDFPKGWCDWFDSTEGEPEEYVQARAFMERWLAEDGFRVWSLCGGIWLNGKSGLPISPSSVS